MANMRDQMSAFISAELRKTVGDKFIQLGLLEGVSVKKFYLLQEEMKKDKKIQIKSITPISNNLTTFMFINPTLERGHDDLTQDRTGVYQIDFTDDTSMMIGTYLDFRGHLTSILGGLPESWYLFKAKSNEVLRKQEKPQTGIYNIQSIHYAYKGTEKVVLNYKAGSWSFKGTPIHGKIEVLEKEIEYFFANLKRFSRYGQIPFRKLITVGPPGTGKSSINSFIASKLKDKYSIVFSQNIQDIAFHLSLCAKHDVPTVVFYDDAEHTLGSSNSEFLNFLSGSNTPNMKKGAMIIFTSNMTEYIEPRVLQRPGRIDRIIEIEPLKGDMLLQCAKMYFEGLDWKEKESQEWIDLFEKEGKKGEKIGLTGAEIQGLAQYCYQKANMEERELNYQLVKDTKEQMEKELNTAYEMIEKNSMVKRYHEKAKEADIGFKTHF